LCLLLPLPQIPPPLLVFELQELPDLLLDLLLEAKEEKNCVQLAKVVTKLTITA
jgi:hypothetical protein